MMPIRTHTSDTPTSANGTARMKTDIGGSPRATPARRQASMPAAMAIVTTDTTRPAPMRCRYVGPRPRRRTRRGTKTRSYRGTHTRTAMVLKADRVADEMVKPPVCRPAAS